jgi:ribonuclease-3
LTEDGEIRAQLEARLGHRFERPELLQTALAHPSFAHETDGTRGNERLELLGDAVLGLVVAELLYAGRPDWNEGDLTRARAALVNARSLAARARSLDLGAFVRLGRTEQRTGGATKDSILCNVFEAVLGAVHLDAGLGAARAFVERVFGDDLLRAPTAARDSKTRLQEWAHAQLHETPTYRSVRDSGIDEDAERFEVEVWISGEAWARGMGRTKRQAEQAAAESAFARAERTP